MPTQVTRRVHPSPTLGLFLRLALVAVVLLCSAIMHGSSEHRDAATELTNAAATSELSHGPTSASADGFADAAGLTEAHTPPAFAIMPAHVDSCSMTPSTILSRWTGAPTTTATVVDTNVAGVPGTVATASSRSGADSGRELLLLRCVSRT